MLAARRRAREGFGGQLHAASEGDVSRERSKGEEMVSACVNRGEGERKDREKQRGKDFPRKFRLREQEEQKTKVRTRRVSCALGSMISSGGKAAMGEGEGGRAVPRNWTSLLER